MKTFESVLHRQKKKKKKKLKRRNYDQNREDRPNTWRIVAKSFGQKRTYSELIFVHGFFSIHSKVVQNATPFLN
jgi:hypothetical protein